MITATHLNETYQGDTAESFAKDLLKHYSYQYNVKYRSHLKFDTLTGVDNQDEFLDQVWEYIEAEHDNMERRLA